MERCPSCKAKIRDNLHCQRCGTDLQWLLQIERQAQCQFECSVQSFAEQALTSATAQAKQAVELHRLPLYLCWYRFLLAQ